MDEPEFESEEDYDEYKDWYDCGCCECCGCMCDINEVLFTNEGEEGES
ncbi:hypothetical protein [Amycolatopsis sp.]|nr:hypothetical protein [Amycolatopsis sp.]HVV11627.1 hypothetical protein [Amycolatopsis sp.]